MHPHHISGKASLLLCSKERAKGGKEGRKEENLAYLVGVRDQLLQRLHPLRYPLPPELQQTRGQREREDTTETESI
jgi:hypothetical protein